jgi:hypothetical protein
MMDKYTYFTLCYAITRTLMWCNLNLVLDTMCYRKLSIIIVHKINYAFCITNPEAQCNLCEY